MCKEHPQVLDMFTLSLPLITEQAGQMRAPVAATPLVETTSDQRVRLGVFFHTQDALRYQLQPG